MPSRTPRTQTRSQYNPHWGEYASAAALPNASGAPLAAANFVLQSGDLAFVTGVGLYCCTSPGTVGGGDAAWARAGGGGALRLSFDGEHTGNTPEVIGAVYLDAGTLAATSEVLAGVIGAGTCTVRLVRQSDATVIATWATSGPLGGVALGAPAAVTAGWYVFDLAGDASGTVVRCYGARLES